MLKISHLTLAVAMALAVPTFVQSQTHLPAESGSAEQKLGGSLDVRSGYISAG
jgi:hypothetical protein